MSAPKWLSIALDELSDGVVEVPGDGDNPRIVEFHSYTTLKATDDETAWCSAFLCFCMEKGGYASTKSAAARSWLNWGTPCPRDRIGAVVILKRGTSTWQGHVTLFLGRTPNGNLICLGANQNDSVSVSVYSKQDLLGMRWPKDAE